MAHERCPACGFEQVQPEECPRCGIVFAKWERRQTSPPPAPERPPAEPDEPAVPDEPAFGRRATLAAAVLLILVLAGGAGLALWLRAAEQAVVAPPDQPALLDAEPRRPSLPPPAATSPRPGRPAPASPEAAPARHAPAGPAPVACRVFGADVSSDEVLPPRATVSTTWHEDAPGWDAARSEQERVEAPLLLYVYVDWCPHCRRAERATLYLPETDAALQGVLKVRLNPEHRPRDKALATELDVKGYPRLLLFSAPGRSPLKLSVTHKVDGKWVPMTPAAFAAEVQDALGREARQHVSLGRERFEADDLSEALTLLQRALRLDARYGRAFYWRGQVRQALGEEARAVTDWRLAAALAPKEPWAWALLGEAALRRRCFAEARGYATEALGAATKRGQRARAHGLRAGALLGLGDAAGATREATAGCRLGGGDACRLLKRIQRSASR